MIPGLYNRTYEKLIGQDATTDSKNNVSIVTSSGSYTDLQITCTLDFGEPINSQATSIQQHSIHQQILYLTN